MTDTGLVERALAGFGDGARAVLEAALEERAVLPAASTEQLLSLEALTLDQLMLRLLPLAAAYAVVPISGYRVGAVAEGLAAGGSELYLGANLEFEGGSLAYSVHAEQAAVTSAWVNGQAELGALAVSAAPCGYCRQFLNELHCASRLGLLLPLGGKGVRRPLTDFLPQAFGPGDLGVSARLLEPSSRGLKLTLKAPHAQVEDALVGAALAAAERSYAPYTRAYAGVALQAEDGAMVAAPYAENAAYNPSQSPLSAAASVLQTNRPLRARRGIQRAVLVEVAGKSSQLSFAAGVLACHAPGVSLEYFHAEVADSSRG